MFEYDNAKSEPKKAKRGGTRFGGTVPEPLQQARRVEALNRYMNGYSFRQIGEQLGVSHTTVGKYIKHELTENTNSSQISLTAWRRFMNLRYERVLRDLHEREKGIKPYEGLDPKDLHSMLGIQKLRLQVYKGQREMNGLDIRQDDPALKQQQVTHFVLRPGGAMDLDFDKPKEGSEREE
jgi:hypothetical protein